MGGANGLIQFGDLPEDVGDYSRGTRAAVYALIAASALFLTQLPKNAPYGYRILLLRVTGINRNLLFQVYLRLAAYHKALGEVRRHGQFGNRGEPNMLENSVPVLSKLLACQPLEPL